MSRLAVVTASLDLERAAGCVQSWRSHAVAPPPVYVVSQAQHETVLRTGTWVRSSADLEDQLQVRFYKSVDILGVVPAFAIGVQRALEDGHEIIACLHDDLEIQEPRWDETVSRLFRACPRAGLCGFGGAKGLGDPDIYQTPYNPHQLARREFRSNMRDAEAHGVRSQVAEPVACLDGFSQIGLASFWRQQKLGVPVYEGTGRPLNLFEVMQQWGVTHHFYDGMLGCFAKRLGYQVWYLPIACHHSGGATAVGDKRYQKWANAQPITRDSRGHMAGGDQGFWLKAHQVGYDEFKDVLPIRT